MTAIAQQPHPVLRAVTAAREQLSSTTGLAVWSMTGQDTTAAIDDVLKAEAGLAELKARLVAHAGQVDLPGETATASTAKWLAQHTKLAGATAARIARFAEALDTHDQTRTALAEGQLHVEQAEVILKALADLPDNLDPENVGKAEAHLLAEAEHHDAKALRHLGHRLLEVIDPDVADAHEAKLLEREEAAAERATHLVMWDDHQGRTHGRFTVDQLTGAMLKKHLHALAAPRHRASQGPLGERRPSPERLGQAFVELVQRYPVKKLPKAGGLNATIVVTMTLDSLLGGLKAAQLDTGGRISAALARRLACEAGIIPAVLGGKSQVLDLGRKRRFATPAQRIAKTIETAGCQIEGCDTPPAMTHLHHLKRWSDGGHTDMANQIMICPWHHARAHDHRYRLHRDPDGRHQFHRRA